MANDRTAEGRDATTTNGDHRPSAEANGHDQALAEGTGSTVSPPAQGADSNPTAPASPPLPQKHTPVTPGPRAARFIETYNLATRRTLSRVDYENIAACFPTISTYAPTALRNVQKQMVDYLEERCQKDFQTILEERDVVRKLNELESLVSQAEHRRRDHPEDAPEPIPPHTLPPETVVRAHLHPHLAHQQSQLNAALANTKLENESLFEKVKAQRSEIEELLEALEEVVSDVDGANALLNEVAPELADEARRANADMADVDRQTGA